MYSRALEQVGVSVTASVLGMISVFMIVESVDKTEYGIFISAFALQYVIARVILSGILVEIQLRLATAANTNGTVPWTLLMYTIGAIILTALVFVALWSIQWIVEPTLGLLISVSMTVSIAALSMRSWFWYRASILVPELMLIGLIYLWRREFNLEALYQIYCIYYGVQGILAMIGLLSTCRRIRLTRTSKTTFGNLAAGSVASLSVMGRDRLAVAVAGYLFSPGAVAELAYLMTVVKGALSIGGTLNSVKFVHLAGKRNSIILGRILFLLENLALASLTLLGYLTLWLYTRFFGNTDYLSTLTGLGGVVMTVSVVLIFNHSIWYSNLVLRGRLWIYSLSSIIFLIAFAILTAFLSIIPILNVTLFYVTTQALLVASAAVFRRKYASKAF